MVFIFSIFYVCKCISPFAFFHFLAFAMHNIFILFISSFVRFLFCVILFFLFCCRLAFCTLAWIRLCDCVCVCVYICVFLGIYGALCTEHSFIFSHLILGEQPYHEFITYHLIVYSFLCLRQSIRIYLNISFFFCLCYLFVSFSLCVFFFGMIVVNILKTKPKLNGKKKHLCDIASMCVYNIMETMFPYCIHVFIWV